MVLSCSRLVAQIQDFYVQPGPGGIPIFETNPPVANLADCNDPSNPSNPCPYDNQPTVYFPVNFHFILTSSGRGNFTETGDGFGNKANNGYQRAEDIVKAANEQLQQNSSLAHATAGQPVCKMNFQVVLKGVFFHRTNLGLISTNPVRYKILELGVGNAKGTAVPVGPLWPYIEARLVNTASEYNIMLVNNDDTSSGVSGEPIGVFKTHVDYDLHTKNNPANLWPTNIAAKNLLHEIFHNMGLDHPYDKDECNDTPKIISPDNNQQWDYNSNGSNAYWSNNLMDYSSEINWALSPCQICILQNNVANAKTITATNNCPPVSAFFKMTDAVCAKSDNYLDVWLQGAASFNETKHTIEIFEVASAGSNTALGNIVCNNYNGTIGNVNLSDDYRFDCGKTYRVRLTVENDCGAKSEQVGYVTTECGECTGKAANPDIREISISPNPTSNMTSVTYELNNDKAISICVIDKNTGITVTTITNNESVGLGAKQLGWDCGYLSNGAYYLQIKTNADVKSVLFTIQR